LQKKENKYTKPARKECATTEYIAKSQIGYTTNTIICTHCGLRFKERAMKKIYIVAKAKANKTNKAQTHHINPFFNLN
jgi:hypothetical protein